ncbi:MAG: carbamoyl-phosphate synthase small subunit [Spirochaetaceae bacterium]|nr:MAG: carbamoyl-phosphate synthase small subunit [Spirochaetaceae bacterium]
MDRIALVLADGTTYQGINFGAPAPLIEEVTGDRDRSRLNDVGEVVFNTAMSGYGEVLTDPSYTGQIVVMTYPHVGNYGIDEAWSETGTEANVPRAIQLAALVVRSLYTGPVPQGRLKLDDYLRISGIPGATGIDTRALTLDLRDRGSRNGLLCRPADGMELSRTETNRAIEFLREFPSMEGRGLIEAVGTKVPVQLPGSGGPHLALYDCGAKTNIIRELQALGCSISIMPSTATAAEIRSTGAQALMLSNGPGDPAVLKHQVAQTRLLLGTLPVLGICLGHQIIAEAAGARTSKMKFGHHGVNHPVREEIPPPQRERGRVFVTSQNHGFTVDEDTLPEGLQVWFRNANDGTVEGLRDDARRIRTTQFHPESAPGPTDGRWIFSAFLEAI